MCYLAGIVIGINLTQLAKIGLEGVNEFRWNTKVTKSLYHGYIKSYYYDCIEALGDEDSQGEAGAAQ